MAGLNTFKTVVEQDRMELLLRYPFYGRVICQCELVPVQSPNAPIACNDCRHIYLLESAYMALSTEDRLLVLAHEVLHITLRHAFRKGNREEERFSFAADAEIFPLLRDEFPQASLRGYRKAWDGLTAEEIYERLPKKLPEPPPMHCYPSNTPSDDGHPDKGNGDHSDEESLSHGGVENADGAKEDANGQETGKSDDRTSNVLGEETTQTDDEGQGEGDHSGSCQSGNTSGDMDGMGSGNTSDAEDEDAAPSESQENSPLPAFDADTEMFCRNLSAEAQLELRTREGRGDTPGNLLRLLEKINTAHIDWKSLLRQFIREVRGGSYRWLPPNRRFISRRLYLPGRRQKMFRGVVALDTSGSTVEDLPGFVGEVEHLMRSFGKFELTVIECDAKVGNVTVVSSDTKPHDWRRHRFSGGGGTDFTPVFEYIEGRRIRPDVLLFFTDGDGDCPENRPSYPVLWLLTENDEPPVSWGFHIKMKG